MLLASRQLRFLRVTPTHSGKIRIHRRLSHMPTANSVQKPEELVQIVNEVNQAVSKATRAEMRTRNLIHRCSFVLVENTKVGLHYKKDVKMGLLFDLVLSETIWDVYSYFAKMPQACVCLTSTGAPLCPEACGLQGDFSVSLRSCAWWCGGCEPSSQWVVHSCICCSLCEL